MGVGTCVWPMSRTSVTFQRMSCVIKEMINPVHSTSASSLWFRCHVPEDVLRNQRDDQPCPLHLHVISLVCLPACLSVFSIFSEWQSRRRLRPPHQVVLPREHLPEPVLPCHLSAYSCSRDSPQGLLRLQAVTRTCHVMSCGAASSGPSTTDGQLFGPQSEVIRAKTLEGSPY